MRRTLQLLATSALSLGLVATASVEARAGTTYTPAGGPSVRLVGANIDITDVPAGQQYQCTQFDVAGQVDQAGVGRAFGSAALDLGSLTYACTNPIMGHVTITVDPAWTLDVTGPATGTTWPVRLSGVSMRIVGAACDLRFAGTVPGSFDTSTQRFTPTTLASTMAVTSATGSFCVNLDFQPGDQVVLSGYFTNVPPSGSTPLSLS